MLVLDPAVHRALVDHAETGAPDEVCGVLAGHRDEDGTVRVDESRRVPNVAADPRAEYRLDPEAHFAAMNALETGSRTVVGFYHSHPAGPARPSPTDEVRALWPGYVYVIVGLDGEPSVGAWTWTGEAFEAETVRVGD